MPRPSPKRPAVCPSITALQPPFSRFSSVRSFRHLSVEPRSAAGLDVSRTFRLRRRVALPGLRPSSGDIAWGGIAPVLAVVALVTGTMAASLAFASLTDRGTAFGTLAGGAVAIRGAFAALARAVVLPRRSVSDHDMRFVVAAVTTFTTVALVLDPILRGA